MDKTRYKENPNIEYEYVGNKVPNEIFKFYNYINFVFIYNYF